MKQKVFIDVDEMGIFRHKINGKIFDKITIEDTQYRTGKLSVDRIIVALYNKHWTLHTVGTFFRKE